MSDEKISVQQLVRLARTRRRFLYGAGAVAASGVLRSSYAGAVSNLLPSAAGNQPVPIGGTVTSSVEITDKTIGILNPEFCGFSFEKSVMRSNTLSGDSHNFIKLFKLLGPGVIRIGANAVDKTSWNPHGKGDAKDEICPADLERLVAFVKATGWRIIYGVNLATSSPARAASEAYHAVQSFGTSLIGIEIGNEPDFFHLNSDLGPAAAWNPQTWILNFKAFVEAIHKYSPGAPIVGPALGMHMEWLQAMIAARVKNLVLYTAHYYITANSATNATIDGMLKYPEPGMVGFTASMRANITNTGIPFRIGECNSFSGGGKMGVSNSCASSLWAIEMMFAAALGRAIGVNFHVGYSPRSYTPITFNNVDATGVQPEYYGIYFMSMVGSGSIKKTVFSSAKTNCNAFAVKAVSGGFNVVITNKDQQQNLQITLSAGQEIKNASLICMSNPSLAGLSGTTIQGMPIPVSGDFKPMLAYDLATNGSEVSFYVPTMSAVLVKIG